MARLGRCSLCGNDDVLTFEHVPPKAAFNDRLLRAADLQHHFSQLEQGDPDNMRTFKQPRGAGAYTLCARCNNATGSWYVPAYVDWTYQGMGLRDSVPSGTSLSLPFHIFPGRIVKQLACMFASACGVGFTDKNPELRKFVLDPQSREFPRHIRLYLFFLNQESSHSRQAGITGLLSGSKKHVFAEISFPPYGYLMTLDSSPPDQGLTDITFFTESDVNEFRSIHLAVSMREVHTYFPGDFRTAEEWRQAKAAVGRDAQPGSSESSAFGR